MIWDNFLTARDKAVFDAAGYGAKGRLPERPALVLIGHEAARPGGVRISGKAGDALHVAAALAQAARAREMPVIHVLDRRQAADVPPRQGALGIDARDIVLHRHAPSAFFETDLMGFLNLLRADGLILAGGTTAGAIRATAIDAFSLNLHTIIPIEACYDDWQASHALSLFELGAKHSEVLPVEKVHDLIRAIPQGLFDLPAGGDHGASV